MRIAAATIVLISGLATACSGDEPTEEVAVATPAAAPVAPEVGAGDQAARQPPAPTSQTHPHTEPPPVRSGVPSTIPMPPADAATPPLAANAQITYVCESGLPVVVTFDGARTTVRLPDGREFMLTRAGGGAGGREEYRGGDVTLVRVANVIELFLSSEGTRMRCAESSATA